MYLFIFKIALLCKIIIFKNNFFSSKLVADIKRFFERQSLSLPPPKI